MGGADFGAVLGPFQYSLRLLSRGRGRGDAASRRSRRRVFQLFGVFPNVEQAGGRR